MTIRNPFRKKRQPVWLPNTHRDRYKYVVCVCYHFHTTDWIICGRMACRSCQCPYRYPVPGCAHCAKLAQKCDHARWHMNPHSLTGTPDGIKYRGE